MRLSEKPLFTNLLKNIIRVHEHTDAKMKIYTCMHRKSEELIN